MEEGSDDTSSTSMDMMSGAAGSGSTKPKPGDDGSDGKDKGDGRSDEGDKQPEEPLGDQTEFVSADLQGASSHGVSRASSSSGAAGAAAPATPATMGQQGAPGANAADASAATVTSVERGDIYRVLSDQRILNLNAYRGVQIIDVSDVEAPRVEGRLAVAGYPVEMYVVGDRAFVLLNGWQGYYGARDELKVRRASGGLVMSVDLRDRKNPKLIDQAEVSGDILTSRLTQSDNGQAALFVAARYYDNQPHSIVKSFEVSSGMLDPKSELDLGGSVQDIQATTDLMMVASSDYSKEVQRSTVTVIDISHADGSMVQGGSVSAKGFVQSKFNMDAYKGVLRVVSGSSWNGVQTNNLETFSLSDLQNLTAIDSCQLGADAQDGMDGTATNDQLYATIFLENRAFFVTYYRVDPFHAFSIDDAGHCQEHNEFVVTGWNNFLKPTMDDTRLLGVGYNDENNTRMLSVSLYDAVDLDNSSPLLARADVSLNAAYSEANWDDRAISVLEGAVSVPATDDNTEETGLLLLPYSGWDPQKQSSISQVQLFTFSDHTLTKRGIMDHGSPVRRSFEVEAAVTGNLSDETLSLFDTGDPDQPEELGRLDVSPSYSRVFVYGDYVARLHDAQTYYYTRAANMTPLPSEVQVVSGKGDVDANPALARFDVPAGASLTQVGQLLVSVYTETSYDANGKDPTSHSQIHVFDLSDPLKPMARGTLETDRIQPYYYGGIYPAAGGFAPGVACFDCIYPRAQAQSYVVGQALVFANITQQQESQGFVTQCNSYPLNRDCTTDSDGNWSCDSPYYSGGITCITPDGGEEQCTGQFYLCDETTAECEPSDPPMFTNRSCNHYEQFRTWQSYQLDTLDLRDPDKLSLAKRVELPTDEEGTSLLAVGETLYFNFQQPYDKPGDARSYVKHYARRLGFADPQKPKVGKPINIPGEVIAAKDTTLYTRDFVWKDADARTLVARLTLKDGAAHLQASELFEDRQVSAVKLDGAGHVLVSSDPVYPSTGPIVATAGVATPARPVATMPAPAKPVPEPLMIAEEPVSKLSILDAQDLSTLGEAAIDNWATFQDAKQGRALFQVPGGLLIVDVHDAMDPKAQAYFPVAGWPSDIVFDGDAILFAAGRYGLYRLDAGVFNLLMP